MPQHAGKSLSFVIAGIVVVLAVGCASVPKESVELSVTVGRDIAIVREAHVQLANLLYDRMDDDVNRFIDEVYAPCQIEEMMMFQMGLAPSDDPDLKSSSILVGIDQAFRPDASPELQSIVLEDMGFFYMEIWDDIESKRQELISPLKKQRNEVIASIDRAYHQIHYANSIVTGHLASVVEVHDAQEEVLASIGVERDLRADIGIGLAEASEEISGIVGNLEEVDKKFEMIEGVISKMEEKLSIEEKDE